MADTCCSNETDMMVLACSGGSSPGLLSNQAALELAREGFGKLGCLAGIGGGIDSIIQEAKSIETIIVIDGCGIACGKACLEMAGVPFKHHVIVSTLAVKATNDPALDPDDVAAVKHAVRLAVKQPVKVSFNTPKPLSPGDRARSRLFGKPCC